MTRQRRWAVIAVLAAGCATPVWGHIGSTIYPVYELSDQDTASLDLHDGSIAEWDAVLGEPMAHASQFHAHPEVGEGAQYDPTDLDFRIWMGWHQATNRIYVAMERTDDVYLPYPWGQSQLASDGWKYDSLEFMIDGDHSGGEYNSTSVVPWAGQTAQHYMVLAESGGLLGLLNPVVPWAERVPLAAVGGQTVGSGPATSVVEFYVTPYNHLTSNSQTASTVSRLTPNQIIGLNINMPDFDSAPGSYHAFHTLSGQAATWRYADRFVDARLVPADGSQPDSGGSDSGGSASVPTDPTPGQQVTVSLPGGATMDFVWIEPGTAMLWAPDSDPGAIAGGRPQHQVTFTKGFYLGKYEITQGQWQAVTGAAPWEDQNHVQASPNHPAVYISWNDVQAFVHNLNQAAGDSLYRLPTEAEWEYACRAGTTTTWSFGDAAGRLGDYAWYQDNTWNVGLTWTQAVGLKLPNPWGLCDMHGNAWEWVQDWWGDYPSGALTDPQGPSSGTSRVGRGGDISNGPLRAASSHRYHDGPDFAHFALGARLVRMASAISVDHPPTSNAGPDQTVTAGATVQLDGTASTDPEGEALTYRWTPPAGVTLTSLTAPRPTFTAGTAGTYRFTLVVAAGQAESAPDTVLIVAEGVPAAGTIARIAGGVQPGPGGDIGDGGQAIAACLSNAKAPRVDDAGNVYMADTYHDRIRRIDARTGIITSIVGPSDIVGGLGVTGPHSTCFDRAGNLYFTCNNYRVVKRDARTGVLSLFAGRREGFGGDGGPASAALLSAAFGIDFDDVGNAYIADGNNNRVRRVDAVTGIITTVAGSGPTGWRGGGYTGDGGPANEAQLNGPSAVAVDGAGNLYIAELFNNCIRRVAAGTGIISTVVRDASAPWDVFADPLGGVYYTEHLPDGRVCRWDPDTRAVTVVAGGGSLAGYTGSPTALRLDRPIGVCVDRAGNVYIAAGPGTPSDPARDVLYRISVSNRAPSLSIGGSLQVAEANETHLTLSGADPDGDALTYSMLGAPDGARLSGTVFTWTPTYQQAGVYTIVFVASDGKGGTAQQTAPITIQNVNRLPVLLVSGSLTAQEGLSLALAVTATDPDGDSLAVAVSGNPPGSFLADGLFSWTPGYNAAGSYPLTFTVSDGRGGQDAQTVTITVSERNGPPVLTRPVAQTVREMDPLRLLLSASDPDGERLTYAVSDSVAGAILTDSVFTWTPGLYTRGTYRLRFAVADTRAGTDTATAIITVAPRTRYITTSTDTLSFGAVAAGSSKSLSLTISNAGTEAMSVTNVIPGDPQYSVSTGSFSLQGGSSRDLTVTFAPVMGRPPATTLTILSNDPDRPALTLALTASSGTTGGLAAISVLPTSLSFGSVALGQSRSVTLVVTNDGGSSLRVLNIVSSSSEVTVSKNSFTLAAGAEELLTVTLQPTTAGNFSETLDIPSNDPAHPVLQVPLRATVGTSGGRPSLALDTPSLSFGQVAIGETSEFLLPVRNSGTAPLILSNVVSDNVQVVASPTTISIPPQEARSLTVRYRPMPGMPLSGRLTLYSNDAAQPQVALSWSAVEVRSPYLSLTRVTPADGSFGVATATEIQLVFSEPLYFRRGFTALDLAVLPEPLSGPAEDDVQVRGDGRTVVIPVTLAPGTVYRLVVYGATGRSGLELFDMVESSFSTGAAPPVLAKVSGQVAVSSGDAVTGSVYLYDSAAKLAGQANVALNNSFELSGVQEGTYRLYVDGVLADGRAATGTFDGNGDGIADPLTVRAGVDQAGLSITATVRAGTAPVVSSSPVAVDLDSTTGNQGFATLGGVEGGRPVVLEVYATAADSWTGAAMTVAFDSTQVSYAGAEAGSGNLLQKNGGTALFLSHVDPAASTAEFGGAILGPTTATAVSGAGLLGRFRFTTADRFTGETALRVTLVKVQSLTGRTNVEPNVQALVRSSGSGSATEEVDSGPLTLDFNPADSDQAQRSGGSAVVGRSYVVQLHATGAPPINGWSARIEYDPVQIRYVPSSFVASSLVPGMIPLVDERSTSVSIGGAVLGGSGSGSGDGLLGTATFEVLSGFTGETELVIRQMSWRRIGSGEEILTCLTRGTITATAAGLAGDFNDDGEVNFGDFFLFADAFGGTDPLYDLSGDGEVSFSDFFLFADAFGGQARAKLMELAHQYLGLPIGAGLESAYPNPFNASTAIRYRLAEAGAVRLAIYGLTGQQVRELVNDQREPGIYETLWDGRGDDGEAVSTGVYLVRLDGPARSQIRKVTMLR